MNENEKETILKEIQTLLSHDTNGDTFINPDYLAYFELQELQSIRDQLRQRVGKLKPDDIQWLKTFE